MGRFRCNGSIFLAISFSLMSFFELKLELIQTQMAQKPMLRAEVGMRVRCANKASAELLFWGILPRHGSGSHLGRTLV